MFAFLKRTKNRPQLTVEPEAPTLEVGSFAHGACSDCDWRGPGRRARSMAVHDAQGHSLACKGEQKLSA